MSVKKKRIVRGQVNEKQNNLNERIFVILSEICQKFKTEIQKM